MKRAIFYLLLSCLADKLIAQNVQINIDPLSGRRTISPYIYGRNGSLSDDPGSPLAAGTWQIYKDAGVNFFRENGGNNLTKYNWRLKLDSHPDWYNNVYASDWDFAATSLHQNIPSAQGMWGFQLIGETASNNAHNFDDWDFNGSQGWTGTAQNLAGGGLPNTGGGSAALRNGDTTLYLERWPADSTTGILNHWFGPGGLGLDSTKIRYWNMDNEIEIWSSTHDDVMPTQLSAEAFMQLYFAVAKKARALFPGIKLSGPVSPNEWQWYNWSTGLVTGSDGKQYPWLQYFIKRIAEEEQRTGIRLLDVIDLHFYPGSTNPSDLVQYHRVFFDSTYAWPEANGVKVIKGGWDPSIQIEDVFGRAQNWLNQYLGAGNGVSFALSETGLQIQSDPNTLAVWYASTMGEFMKHNVEYFSPWSWDKGMWEALHLYSRYNKTNSIQATSSDELNVSAYASADNNNDSLTIVLVNRSTTDPKTVTLNFSNFLVAGQAAKTLTLSNLPVGTETFVSHTNNALRSSTITPSGNTLQVTIAPLSVTSIQIASGSVILPVALASFTASKNDNGVRLDFSTTDQVQLSYFEIERSANGASFDSIGTVPATTSLSGNDLQNGYTFFDAKPLSSLNYYRLKMTDKDGSFTYSKVVTVYFGSSVFSVFPNPAKDLVNVQMQFPAGTIVLQIMDAVGRQLRAVSVQSTGAPLSTPLDISSLPKGLYYIRAGTITRSFIKK
jgi:Glycoside hydrolase family 44/Secretion system C-terminal sorting domain